MTSRREQIAIEALREIAKRDKDGSGVFAQQALDRIADDDAAHMDDSKTHNLSAESLTVDRASGGFA